MNEEAPLFSCTEMERALEDFDNRNGWMEPLDLAVTLAALYILKGASPTVTPIFHETNGGSYRVTAYQVNL